MCDDMAYIQSKGKEKKERRLFCIVSNCRPTIPIKSLLNTFIELFDRAATIWSLLDYLAIRLLTWSTTRKEMVDRRGVWQGKTDRYVIQWFHFNQKTALIVVVVVADCHQKFRSRASKMTRILCVISTLLAMSMYRQKDTLHYHNHDYGDHNYNGNCNNYKSKYIKSIRP